MKRALSTLAGIVVLATVHAQLAHSFPIGLSANGSIGFGYYSMADLNSHLDIIRQEKHIKLDELGSGVNFKVEGRIWLFNQVAIVGGYEHYWAESVSEGSSTTLSYKVPADVYNIGLVVTVLRLENTIDLCLGVNRSSAEAVFGTNEIVGRRLAEFKGKNAGYAVYGEIHTNFINPIEVGLQVGYRGLKINDMKDKWGDEAVFDDGAKITIDYSGAFFYLTTAIRI
jgi:hypothetical protein